MRGKNRKVKAATLEGKGLLTVKDYPYPDLDKNCAIIKMEYSGICGTDKHSFEGFFYQKGGRPIPLPVIQGHENVGIIEEINGDLLDHDGKKLFVGDRVVPAPNISCGKCFACRNNRPYYYCECKLDYGNNIGAGKAPHIFGGWSEYLYIIPGSHLFKYPDNLNPQFGTFIEPLSVTGCLDKARQWSSEWEPFRSGDTVVILGTGPIGLFHLIKSHLMGAGKIYAIDPYKFRTSLALEFGASEVITSNDREEIKDNIKETPTGLQYRIINEGNGASPKREDRVKVHYVGKLMDGTEFDSSIKRGQPSEFGLTQVIKGWTEGLQLMKLGAKYEFFIHPKIAYGSRPRPTIPANSLLIFEVELLDIISK